jgi:flagellar operon protein
MVGGSAPLGGARPETIGAPAPARRDAAPTNGAAAGGESFDAVLQRTEGSSLKFSGHARKRIEQRGLNLDAERLRRLEQAVERAEEKGARDSLVLLDELAVVVSVQHRTVITAMDEAARKESVFTNIDSVVIAD